MFNWFTTFTVVDACGGHIISCPTGSMSLVRRYGSGWMILIIKPDIMIQCDQFMHSLAFFFNF